MSLSRNRMVSLYTNSVYDVSPMTGVAICWDYSRKSPVLVKYDTATVDAAPNVRLLVEGWILSRIEHNYRRSHRIKIEDTVFVKKTGKNGVVYKILSKPPLYFVRFGTQMCNEIVLWHGAYHVFENPKSYDMVNEQNLHFVSNFELETTKKLGLTRFRGSPFDMLKSEKYIILPEEE